MVKLVSLKQYFTSIVKDYQVKLTFTLLLTLGIFLTSCTSTKNYREGNDNTKALNSAIKRLNKNRGDESASSAVPILYKAMQEERLGKINLYQSSTELSRWDTILSSYNELQDAYNSIMHSPNVLKVITPVDYSANILETKQLAAEDHYAEGLSVVDKPGRDNAKKSYNAFKRTIQFIDGYKNARLKMDEAYESALVDVVINFVQDSSFFLNSGWGNTGYTYSKEFFQQKLVRDLNDNDQGYAARFYTVQEARNSNVKPDWVVDLWLRNIDLPQPHRSSSQHTVTKQIAIGRDSLGQVIYQNVDATITTIRMSGSARADMEVVIRDIANGANISYNKYPAVFRWDQQSTDYSGDSRALGSNEENLMRSGNSAFGLPGNEEVLEKLYRKIYPQVKNSISYAADW